MYYYNELPPQQGWICPKCGRVNAPWMPTCGCVSSQTSGCVSSQTSGTPYLVETSSISRDSHEIAKDEPQTQLTAKCLECNNSKACKENHWEGCRYEPLGYEVTAVVGTIKDEPQIERSE